MEEKQNNAQILTALVSAQSINQQSVYKTVHIQEANLFL